MGTSGAGADRRRDLGALDWVAPPAAVPDLADLPLGDLARLLRNAPELSTASAESPARVRCAGAR
ncbi:MAG: hypothetical protein ACRC0L_07975, partial [Angustibacter sp.]